MRCSIPIGKKGPVNPSCGERVLSQYNGTPPTLGSPVILQSFKVQYSLYYGDVTNIKISNIRLGIGLLEDHKALNTSDFFVFRFFGFSVFTLNMV